MFEKYHTLISPASKDELVESAEIPPEPVEPLKSKSECAFRK
jgi:hypothetical protein|tara:strand:+ start:821 stop:946 length:126 start_codon:yes stop_codon:yes gene_type:complete